jgi:uncharacterized protein YyaL (SSP411 family)
MKPSFPVALVLNLVLLSGSAAFSAEPIHWLPWNAQVFQQAEKEHKLVLLDLEAVWCHWCHVMDQSTYSNPLVVAEINRNFLPVRVDQDARPDLANRFRDYGWPATIIFNAKAKPLVKRAGYIEPQEMTDLLQHIAAHPQPEDEAAAENTEKPNAPRSTFALSPALKKALWEDHLATYDKQYGSWGVGGQKFLDADSVEYAMRLAQAGDHPSALMAQKTLSQERQLIDPVWGGVYQYSTGGNWSHPHTERIMLVQADALRVYSLAYAMWHRPEDLQAAQAIYGYLATFMTSPEGAFYTSQDAEVTPGKHDDNYFKRNDAERRKLGLPKVDQHRYARENGWAIGALTAYYQATGDASGLAASQKAAEWILQNRALPGGGFSHDAPELALPGVGPYLGDSLAMGEAFLGLYTSTMDRRWLTQATKTADFIATKFPAEAGQAGYLTAAMAEAPYADRMENLRLARWANLLSQITGESKARQMAERAMRYVANATVAQDGFSAAPLLANDELLTPPLHLTVVGAKLDPDARKLFLEALRYPTFYKRVDWWDPKEGPMLNADVTYPVLPQAAAFICTNHRCSLPILKPEELRPRIDQLSRKRTPQTHQEKP